MADAPGPDHALEQVVDSRKARGSRHRLVVLLSVTVCAVAAGARSFVAIAEWVADLPESLTDAVLSSTASTRRRPCVGVAAQPPANPPAAGM